MVDGRDVVPLRRPETEPVSPTAIYPVTGLSLLPPGLAAFRAGRVPVAAPMVLVGVGILVGLTPLADGLDADPMAIATWCCTSPR